MLQLWVVLFNKPSSSLAYLSSFSMEPVLLVVFTMLSLLIFGRPRALIFSFSTRLLFSSLTSLEIRFPGPCLVAANLFHLSWWACWGFNNLTCEAVNLKPARAYLLLPPTLQESKKFPYSAQSFPISLLYSIISISKKKPQTKCLAPINIIDTIKLWLLIFATFFIIAFLIIWTEWTAKVKVMCFLFMSQQTLHIFKFFSTCWKAIGVLMPWVLCSQFIVNIF